MNTAQTEMRVAFHGEGAGIGELTWGQLSIWQTRQRTNRTMNLVWPMRLPSGVTLAAVAEALSFIVGRYPALRTQLRFPGGEAGSRHPRQVIAGAGEVLLHIADIDDDADPEATAEELRSQYELAHFEYEHEFPIRMAAIRQSGVISRLVVGFSHVMLDGAAVNMIFADLKRLGRSAKQPPAAPCLNSLELARRQGTSEVRRHSERAIRHWETQLGRLPIWQLEESGHPQNPRFAELVVYSAAMELGMRAVKARTGAGDTAVVLAAYSAAVARVFGRNPNVAQIVVSNRFRADLSNMVSQVSQHGICVIDGGNAKFDEVVARAHTATTNASRYAYYDPRACDDLIDRIATERGGPLHIAWCVNDRRVLARTNDRRDLTTKEMVTQALRQSKIYWDVKGPVYDTPLFLHIDSEPVPASRRVLAQGSTLPAVYMQMWTDTHQFELHHIETLAQEMERVVVDAAFE